MLVAQTKIEVERLLAQVVRALAAFQFDEAIARTSAEMQARAIALLEVGLGSRRVTLDAKGRAAVALIATASGVDVRVAESVGRDARITRSPCAICGQETLRLRASGAEFHPPGEPIVLGPPWVAGRASPRRGACGVERARGDDA